MMGSGFGGGGAGQGQDHEGMCIVLRGGGLIYGMLRAVEIWILDVITALHFWRDLDVVCAEGRNPCGVDLAFH